MQDRKHYPLTYTQKRVYFSEKASDASQNKETSMYTIGGCLIFEGQADLGLLEQAIIKMLHKFDTFQIRLKETQEGPKQYFSEEIIESLDYYDFNKPQYQHTDILSWCDMKFKEPFPAEEEKPLYYFCVFKTRDNRTGYFLKLHHIIADGWSISLILQTVDHYYTLLKKDANEVIATERMEFSYLNYIASEEKYLSSKSFERDKKFWVEKYKEIPEPLFEVHKSNHNGRRKEYFFSSYTESMLHQIMKEQKVTIPAIISALTAVYYMEYYNKEEIVIGIPVYNREKTTKKVCGLFTSNTLLRLGNHPDRKLRDYVQYTKRELNLCYYHQRYPYDLLVKDIELRKNGRNSLYQVAVNYYNTKLAGEFSGMKENNYELYGGQQFYPLQIVIKDWNDTEGLSIFTDYQTDYFTEKQLDAFMEFLENSIYLLGTQAGITIQEIPLVSEKSRNELIYGYNSYFSKCEITETVLQRMEKQAITQPDIVAVSWKEESITYGELNEKADNLAAFLQERYGKNQQIVAILSNHSVEYVIATLAILKAGYAFLPIDPEYPENRITYMLEDASVVVLLTDQEEFLTKKIMVETLDLRDSSLYASRGKRAERTDNLDALAYVIYTSGSTGKPKGVQVGHRSFSNYIAYAVDTYIKGSDDVFAFFTSISFDLTITSVFTPLASGTQIRIYQKNKKQYGLYDIVEDNKSTIIKLTPSHLMLLNDCDLSDCIMRAMILGGENLLASTVNETYRAFGHTVDIFNEYGPTEATVGCMTYLAGEKKSERYSEAIGYPIANTELYVLNDRHQVLPKGAAGELYIAGDCLAFGYLNKPEATNKAFVQHFMDPSRKMYRTGDIVRLLDNGTMEYIGRGNDYIKFKGYRIETDEIEKTIQASGEVKSVVATCLGEGNEQAIYAFVTGNDVEVTKIQAYCIKYLPEYMVPQFIEVVEQIPLTQNGKTNYKKLEEVAKERSRIQLESLEQDDRSEAFLAVFRQTFQNENIILSDNFFEVGGDSIKAIQVSGVFKKLNKKVPVSDILNYPNLMDLYERFGRRESEERVVDEFALDTELEIPMTPIMKQYFETLYQKDTYYNQSVLLKLHEKVELVTLNQILKKLVATHEMLRIKYDSKEQKLIRRKLAEQDESIAVYNKIPTANAQQQSVYMKDAAQKAREEISLENGVTLKGVLFEKDSGEEYLFLTIHHLGIDGVSWRILLDDFACLLADKRNGETELIATDSFLHWAKIIKERGPVFFEKEKDTWRDMLVKGNSEEQEEIYCCYKEVDKKEICYAKENTALLSEVAMKHYHMRLDELLLSIIGYCLMEQKKQDKILIMTESHGRDDNFSGLDTSRTIGWFTSMYPVLLEVNRGKTWEEELPDLKEQIRSVSHYGIGYGVNKWLEHSIEEETGKTVCFNYLGDFMKALDNEVFTYEDMDMGSDYSQQLSYPYRLEVNAMIVKDSLKISFSYGNGDMQEYEVHKLIEYVDGCLMKIIGEQPEQDVILTPSDFTAVTLSSEELELLFDEEDEDE